RLLDLNKNPTLDLTGGIRALHNIHRGIADPTNSRHRNLRTDNRSSPDTRSSLDTRRRESSIRTDSPDTLRPLAVGRGVQICRLHSRPAIPGRTPAGFAWCLLL